MTVTLPDGLKTYLDNLTPAEGDRVLTGRMTAMAYVRPGTRYGLLGPRREPERCLVGQVLNMQSNSAPTIMGTPHAMASGWYEDLCRDHGLMPTVTAIRLHILQSRIKRELAETLQPA